MKTDGFLLRWIDIKTNLAYLHVNIETWKQHIKMECYNITVHILKLHFSLI
jgi:hypothetical protein